MRGHKVFKLGKSSFFKNFFILFSGVGLSQVLTVIALPFLARNYSSEDFGVHGIYASIFLIVNTVSTGKLEKALFLTKDEIEKKLIATVGILIGVIVALITLFFLIFNKYQGVLSLSSEMENVIFFIPFSILFMAFNNIVITVANTRANYKSISISRVLKVLINLFFSFVFILILNDAIGLVLSEILGIFISGLYLKYNTSNVFIDDTSDLKKIKMIIEKYKKFAIYNVPSDLLNMISNQLPSFFLNLYFGSSSVGNYSLMKKVIDAPVNLLSTSILEVFRKQASEVYLATGNCKVYFEKTAKKLVFFSIPIYLFLLIFSVNIFSYFLGAEWVKAGEMARIFSVFYFFKFVASPLSYMVYIANKQRTDLIIQFYIFISVFFILNLPYFMDLHIDWVLIIFSFNFSLIYIYYFIFSYSLSINK